MAKNASNDANRSPRKTTRGASRELRSVSPTKISPAVQDRVILSPKKRSRKSKKQSAENGVNGASKTLQSVLEAPADIKEAASAVAESVADDTEDLVHTAAKAVNGAVNGHDEDKVDGEEPLPENAARVTVTQETTGEGDDEVKHTKVKIDLPLDAENPNPAIDSEEALARAKEIVDAGIELQASSEAAPPKKASRRGRKRKASEAEAEPEATPAPEEVAEAKAADEVAYTVTELTRPDGRPSKRARTVTKEEEVVREKMQRRAIMGLSATLAVGAMIPFLSNLF